MATITSPRTESPAGNARVNSPPVPYSPSLTGTETTTSSVRPSVELARNDSSSKPAAGPAQRRNRAALRDYYKLKSQPGQAEGLNRTASITSNASDSTITYSAPTLNNDTSPLLAKLDDPSFDAEKFISLLLSTAPLREILRTESTLVSEVRNLDGERKALVYDNYSKLIKAVGTIGNMQKGMQRRDAGGDGGLDGVEKLEEKLHGLQIAVKELGPMEVNGTDTDTTQIKKQRQLVKWVLTAPSRLEGFCRDGKRDDAELEWAKIKQILDMWENVEGVDDVRLACADAMKATPQSGDG